MMKRPLVVIFAALVALLVSTKSALASEGTVTLSRAATDARCFATSVQIDERTYQLVMTCRNLTLPPGNSSLFYLVWAKRAQITPTGSQLGIRPLGREQYARLGELERGKLATSIDEPFTELVVTAEQSDDPDEFSPSRIVVRGTVQPIDFGTEVVEEPEGTPTPVEGATIAPTASPTPVPGARRSVVGTAFRVLLIVVIIIVILAIIISIIQRRSASRS